MLRLDKRREFRSREKNVGAITVEVVIEVMGEYEYHCYRSPASLTPFLGLSEFTLQVLGLMSLPLLRWSPTILPFLGLAPAILPFGSLWPIVNIVTS